MKKLLSNLSTSQQPDEIVSDGPRVLEVRFKFRLI